MCGYGMTETRDRKAKNQRRDTRRWTATSGRRQDWPGGCVPPSILRLERRRLGLPKTKQFPPLDRRGHARRHHLLPARIASAHAREHVGGEDAHHLAIEADDTVDVVVLHEVIVEV